MVGFFPCGCGGVLRARRNPRSMRQRISSSLSWSLSLSGGELAMPSPKSLNLFLDDAQLKAIGLFVAQWTFLETEIDFTIACLGATVDDNQIVPLSFDQKIKRWRSLNKKYHSRQVLVRCESIIKAAEAAHNIRSILSHGRILGSPKGRNRIIAVTHHRHRQSGWTVQPYNLNARLISKWANAIGHLSSRLMHINATNLPGRPTSLPCRFP